MNFKNEDMSAMDPIRFTWNLFSFLDAEASLFLSPIVNDQRFSLLRMQDLKADVSAGHRVCPLASPKLTKETRLRTLSFLMQKA